MRMLLVPCAAVSALLLFFVTASLLMSAVAGWLVPWLFAGPIVWLSLTVAAIAGVSLLLGCCPRGRNCRRGER